jgi:hypothetical protein
LSSLLAAFLIFAYLYPMSKKKFADADNTAVFTTTFVLNGKDITTVYHDVDDGAWQFMSDDEFEGLGTVAKVVGLGEIVKMDSTLLEIADLPLGYYAYRKSRSDSWVIRPIS